MIKLINILKEIRVNNLSQSKAKKFWDDFKKLDFNNLNDKDLNPFYDKISEFSTSDSEAFKEVWKIGREEKLIYSNDEEIFFRNPYTKEIIY